MAPVSQWADPRGEELSKRIRAHLDAGNVLTLRKGDLDSPAIDGVFDKFLSAEGALELHLREQPREEPAHNRITVIGTGVNGLLKGLETVAVFEIHDGTAHIAVTGDTPQGWTLATAISALSAHRLLSSLQFMPRSQLSLASRRVSEAVPDGLFFAGTPSSAGPLDALALLGADTPRRLSGPITFTRGLPELKLSPDATANGALFDLGFLSRTNVDLAVETAVLFDGMRDLDVLTTGFTLSTAIVFHARGKEHRIPLAASFGGSGRVVFTANLTALVDATLDELGALADGHDLGSLFKGLRDFKLSDVLRLQDLRITVNLESGRLESVEFGVESAHPFTLLHDPTYDNSIVLDKVYVTFTLIEPLTVRQLHAELGGSLRIGKGLLTAVATYPDFAIAVCEAPRSNISVREVFQLITGKEQSDVPDLRITELEMFIVPGHEYDVDVEISGHWPIDILGLPLAIDELELAVEHETGSDTKIVLSGRFEIGSLEFGLAAQRPSAEEGWEFSGFTLEDEVIELSKVAEDLLNMFLLDANVRLPELDVWNVNIMVRPHTKQFSFGCEALLKIGETELDAVIDIEINNSKDEFEQRFSGELTVGSRQLDLILDRKTDATFFLATYQSAAGETIRIAEDLIAPINADFARALPANLSITLQDVLVAYESAKSSRLLLGADIGTGVDLSSLPLVGRAFPAGQPLRMTFQPLIATAAFSSDEVAAIAKLVPTGGLSLPKKALESGFTLATTLQLGDRPVDLSLPFAVDKSSGQLTDGSKTATKPAAASDDTKWVSLQKTFGPVHFERIGVRYDAGDLAFLLDASLNAAGLTLALDGLSATVALADLKEKKFQPRFGLRGLGIDYKNSAVEIGGFLMHLPPSVTGGIDEYDGLAVIRTSKLSLAAIGSYAEVNGDRSLFLYAALDYPLGGPAFFFVTGLAAGFGYNRGLRMPDVDKIAEFPLVAAAMQGAKAAPSSAGGAEQRDFLSAQINSMREFVPIQPGQFFFAIGVRFTSFKQIDSFALLAVSFGQHVEVDVLGLSTALIPTPEVGKTVEPIAEVQLALRATFLPDEGVLAVMAVLTSASYVFSRNCHLTGGFAFYTWFSGEHAGDFVLTVGGYHPSYRVPKHYPTVPRLGFNWQVSKELSVKGEAYFALTSNALMAGARLEAIWESGPIKAWFRAGADFLIAWKPYYYEAGIYIDLGASYTFELFGTHHITVELGADLRIWGPDFSGRAEIHLWIVSFTIEFGNKAPRIMPLEWKEFYESFLPPPAEGDQDGVCSVAAQGGLLRRAKDATQHEIWIVNPKELVLVSNSLIPATSAKVGDQDVAHFTPIGVAPMNAKHDAVSTTHSVHITRDDEAVTGDFAFIPVLKRAPAAMWGESMSPDLNGAAAIENTLAGFEIRPRVVTQESVTHAIDRDRLQFDTSVAPTPLHTAPAAGFVAAEKQGRAELRSRMASEETLAARTQLLTALGFDPVDDTVGFAPAAVDEFWFVPVIGKWQN